MDRTGKQSANNRVQRTRHKVSGPLTRDVRKEIIMRILSAIVAITGLLIIGLALSTSHYLHVQIKIIALTADADSIAKVNSLSESVDLICLIFAAFGVAQLACGLIGSRR